MTEDQSDGDHAPDAPAPGEVVGGAFTGMLERADRTAISGWAMDTADPDAVVSLELLIDDVPSGVLPADLYRPDLHQAGLGHGRHGFNLHLPRGIAGAGAHVIRVRRAEDGQELPGSPRDVAPEEGAEIAGQAAIMEALDAAAASGDAAALDRLVEALARQAAGLLFARDEAADGPQAAFVARFARHPEWLPQPPADPRPRALFIDEGVPDGNRDAGSNAAMSHMRALQRLGYRVDFVAGYGLAHAGARTEALQAMGVTCWHAPWVGSVEEVLRRLGEGLEVAYLHRYGVVQRYGALVRRWCPRARLLYCVADLHYLRAGRRRAVQAGIPVDQAPLNTPDIDGLRTAELLAVLGADAVITHSSFEQALLAHEAPGASVHHVAWHVEPRPVEADFAERRGVGFIGSYGHAPNLDAAHVLVETVMPLVWARDASIPCLLAGSDLPASLRAAAEAAPEGGVVVLGQVGDARDLWERVRLTAAPLRYGAGLKGKVLDSLAAGIPCICSPMAAEGMDLPDALAGLVCGTPAAMAENILAVHGDGTLNSELAEAGLSWVAEALSEGRIDAGLAAALRHEGV